MAEEPSQGEKMFASDLLFGDENKTVYYDLFRLGRELDQEQARLVLSTIDHKEIGEARDLLLDQMERYDPNAVFEGNSLLYRSNGTSPDFKAACLFDPRSTNGILLPFVGLFESIHPAYRLKDRGKSYELFFNNWKRGTRTHEKSFHHHSRKSAGGRSNYIN